MEEIKENVKNESINEKERFAIINEKKEKFGNEKEQSAKKDENMKLEESEKIVDIEEPENIDEKAKILIIQIDEDLKKHIEGKFFVLKNLKLDFKILYNKISQKKLLKNLDIFYKNSNAIISYEKMTYIFFYKLIQVEFKILYDEQSKNKTINFSICSTCELLDYCNENNYNPYIEVNNKKYDFKVLFDYDILLENFDKIILVQDYRYYDDYKNEELPTNFPSNNSILEPEKLSKFFELFFKFETKSNIEYWESTNRINFIIFILKYKANIEMHCLKICGPSGIGKSMTLFLISKYYNNYLYYNLKTIRDLEAKKDNKNIQNILKESCKYLRLNKNEIEQLSSLLNDNIFYPFFYCLKKIVEFLIKIKLLSVIILDQFKSDYINEKEYKQILSSISGQESKNVKLLICSTTNDKDIRDECIKSWNSKIFKLSQFNKDNQKYYFYIDELYNINENVNTSYDKVLKEFNYIQKYKNKFKYLKSEGNHTEKLNEDLKIIKLNVETNLKILYKKINEKDKSDEIIMMKMIESLRYLHLNTEEKIDYEKLSEFLGICSFKYYRFKFKDT